MELQVTLVGLGILNAGAVAAMGFILTDLRSRITRLEDMVLRAMRLKVAP
jgi:hypothetical protein